MTRKVYIFGHGGRAPSLLLLLLTYHLTFGPTIANILLDAEIEILEEEAIGSYVGNIVVASNLESYIPQDDIPRLEYYMQAPDDSYFTISASSGSLNVRKEIDRDTICGAQSVCIIHDEVVVYIKNGDSSELSKIIRLDVKVNDINDNDPEFPSKAISLSVPENNQIKDELRTSVAQDADVGDNGVYQYTFEDPTNTFTLNVHSGPDLPYLGIVMGKVLDREARDFYQVVIIARDGGREQRSGSVIVNITVSDTNDNYPVFTQSSYNESVPEDVSTNVPILQLRATDADTGPNADISYQISSQVSADIRNVFYIDETTGEIFAQQSLDYEDTDKYQLVIEAVDHGSPQSSSRVSVTLHVLDVNDNTPQISLNEPPQGTSVSEADEVDKFIMSVTVSDEDSGANALITCTLDDDHFSLEQFGDQDLKVVLAKQLDHEKATSHRVTITCMDNGQQKLSSSKSFVVNVTDVNDVRPIFSEEVYRGVIPENRIGLTEILTVEAHDWDGGEMGRITYSLEDRYDDLFIVDPDRGVIAVTRAVDRETDQATFEFHVIARDNGVEQLASTALVIVDVEDINDEAPRFTRPTFFGEIKENQQIGTTVGNVTATDPDTAPHAKISYSILSQGTDFNKFRINPDTGEIKSAEVFDRENVDTYHITIQAVDPDYPEFYSTCNFTVRILDDNDFSPVITSLRSSQPIVDDDDLDVDDNNATFLVQYTAPLGSVITTVVAYDHDDATTLNGQLYFSIESGNSNDLFSMNRYTGSLALARTVTANDIKTFHLVLRVEDGGDPPFHDSRDVYIKVNGSIAALTAESSSGGISQNILIVIILIGVTIVLALAIMATICLIRKIDRQRRRNRADNKLSEDKMYQLTEQTSPHFHGGDGDGSNHHNRSNGHNGDVFGGRTSIERDVSKSSSYSNNLNNKRGVIGGGIGGGGKKEVSFSLDEESDSHNTSSGSGHPLTSFKGGVGGSGTMSADRSDGIKSQGPRSMGNGVMNIPVPRDKQSNLKRSPHNEECHLIEILKKSAEDALSESSGETDPSDSGRGGSEDESSHRMSGLDPEHSNRRISKGHRSPSAGKDKDHIHHLPQHNDSIATPTIGRGNLRPPHPSRQLSSSSSTTSVANTSATASLKSRPHSRGVLDSSPSHFSHRENPRDSLTSDFGSDFSGGSRPPSQSRTDSDRSVPPPPPAPRPAIREPGQMLPFKRPSPVAIDHHSPSSSPSSFSSQRELPNHYYYNVPTTSNPAVLPSSRQLLTRDSPNRLAGPAMYNNGNSSNNANNYSNSLMRSFHGRTNNPPSRPYPGPNLSSSSMDRIPRAHSTSPTQQPPAFYSDRVAGGNGFYPSIPERWDPNAASSIMAEEDDMTTTSGSYSINPDELRQEIDELILQDSVV